MLSLRNILTVAYGASVASASSWRNSHASTTYGNGSYHSSSSSSSASVSYGGVNRSATSQHGATASERRTDVYLAKLEGIQVEMMELFKLKYSTPEARREKILSLGSDAELGFYADSLFREAVALSMNADNEAQKACCRSLCCCCAIPDCLMPTTFDKPRENMFFQQFTQHLSMEGVDCSEMSNLYNRMGFVIKLREFLPFSERGTMGQINFTITLPSNFNMQFRSAPFGPETHVSTFGKTYNGDHFNVMAAQQFNIGGHHYTIYDDAYSMDGFKLFRHRAGVFTYYFGNEVLDMGYKAQIKQAIDNKLAASSSVLRVTFQFAGADKTKSGMPGLENTDKGTMCNGHLALIIIAILVVVLLAAAGAGFAMKKRSTNKNSKKNDEEKILVADGDEVADEDEASDYDDLESH